MSLNKRFLSSRVWLRWTLTLLGISALACLLVLTRIYLTNTGYYTFMIWNLFLAWIPYAAASGIVLLAGRAVPVRYIRALLGVLWLLFLPNAPYVVTDWIHFSYIRGARVWPWFDVFLLSTFAWLGMWLGLLSLFMLHRAVVIRYGRLTGWGFALTALLLSSVGVYVGRVLRWNSWEVFIRPGNLLEEARTITGNGPVLFVGLVFLFSIAAYAMITAFAGSTDGRRSQYEY